MGEVVGGGGKGGEGVGGDEGEMEVWLSLAWAMMVCAPSGVPTSACTGKARMEWVVERRRARSRAVWVDEGEV